MFKVGDKVRVRKDLKLDDYIQGYYVTNAMYSKIGQVITISKIFHKGVKDYMCYEVEELEHFSVAFTDAMFELDESDEEEDL